jgi:hypothetical protein
MKRIMIVAMLLGLVSAFAKAESFVYSGHASTGTLTGSAAGKPGNTKVITGVCRIKQIVVHQNYAVKQVLTLYKNFTSTTAATVVDQWTIPATVGMYYPWGDQVISNALGNFDIVNCPDLHVKTDYTGDVGGSAFNVSSSCVVSIIYGK